MTFVLNIGSAEMSLSLIDSKLVKSGTTVIGVMISYIVNAPLLS